MTRYQVKEFFSNAGSTVKSNIGTIPTPQKAICKDKANELIPKYLILSSKDVTQVDNFWTDGMPLKQSGQFCWDYTLTLASFRMGSNQGENINYLYFNPDSDYNTACNITYSKQVISAEGNILGTISFTINPILKLREKQIKTNEGEYNGSTDTYTFKWSGFDEEMKKIYGADKITFRIIRPTMSSSDILCEDESSKDEGEYICKGLAQAGWDGQFGTCLWCYKFEIKPDIYDNKIYEIVEPNIEYCQWVE